MGASINVHVRLFAMLRERAGWREQRLELPLGALISDAWRAIAEAAPALAGFGAVVRFARNGAYADSDEALADGDELAVIPPVAGGEGESEARFWLTADPIADELLAELRRTVPTPADGAVVVFVGQTRETPGQPSPGEEKAAAKHAAEPVEALDYEAFEEMALDVLRAIGAEIEARFGVHRLAIVHRTGRVALGEPSVVICVAAPHRAAAFDACRYAIEELKARAPIWKRERYASGGHWVAADPDGGLDSA
jgi:molybdopterin synthase catalytic subunit